MIIILTILVLGLVGYISYDKFYLEKKLKEEEYSNPNSEENEGEPVVREELSLADTTVQKLFNIFSVTKIA